MIVMAILNKIVEWLLRPRSLAAVWVSWGARVLIAGGGSQLVKVVIAANGGGWAVAIDTAIIAEVFGWISILCVLVGVMMIAVGAILTIADYRQLRRKRVIVIEQRGLHAIDTPLTASLPASIKGRRDPLPVDIREAIIEGKITQPEIALRKVVSAKEDLDRRLSGVDMEDITVVYGGIAPVPFTFLTGSLLEDESQITVFDWARPKGPWRKIKAGGDDGKRFERECEIEGRVEEAILALSVSYSVNLDAIHATFSGIPLMHLKMSHISSDAHWSADKQDAIAHQFLDAVKKLEEKGVKKIHLVIAAPNSVVFNLGQIYDKRLHPEAIVYQYEKSDSPPYPWGVKLPTHGVEVPEIVKVPTAVAGSVV